MYIGRIGRTGVEGMIRKQIYIDQHQNTLLKRKAKVLGVAEAELVREALDRHLAVGKGVKQKTAAWEEEKKFIQSRLELGLGEKKEVQEARRWRREELYDRKDVS